MGDIIAFKDCDPEIVRIAQSTAARYTRSMLKALGGNVRQGDIGTNTETVEYLFLPPNTTTAIEEKILALDAANTFPHIASDTHPHEAYTKYIANTRGNKYLDYATRAGLAIGLRALRAGIANGDEAAFVEGGKAAIEYATGPHGVSREEHDKVVPLAEAKLREAFSGDEPFQTLNTMVTKLKTNSVFPDVKTDGTPIGRTIEFGTYVVKDSIRKGLPFEKRVAALPPEAQAGIAALLPKRPVPERSAAAQQLFLNMSSEAQANQIDQAHGEATLANFAKPRKPDAWSK